MSLGARPSKKTASGLSPETDQFLSKLMKKNGMSQRKQREIKEVINQEGSLPLPPKPKQYKPVTKPKPEQKLFTMARVGQRPLMKQADVILEETNYYQPAEAPSVPLGPSNEEKKKQLAAKMYGVDEEADKKKIYEAAANREYQPAFTMEDQIIEEVQERTRYLEELHEMGIHDHDGETLRQIEMRLEELKKRKNVK